MKILQQEKILFSLRKSIIYNQKLLKLKGFIVSVLNNSEMALIVYADSKEKKLFNLIKQLQQSHELLLHFSDAYQLYKAVECTKKIAGDIAEVGVFRGGSAKIICQAKGIKKLHLFDTFEGFPYKEIGINRGDVKAEMETVKTKIKSKNVFFYKGVFPETAGQITDRRFSFVHLDVDLYKSTLDSLEFFYPRMNKGGIILSHDYYFPSIKKAFTTFFKDKPEPIIDLNNRQCLIIKI